MNKTTNVLGFVPLGTLGKFHDGVTYWFPLVQFLIAAVTVGALAVYTMNSTFSYKFRLDLGPTTNLLLSCLFYTSCLYRNIVKLNRCCRQSLKTVLFIHICQLFHTYIFYKPVIYISLDFSIANDFFLIGRYRFIQLS